LALDIAGLVLALAVLAFTGDQFIVAVARIASALQIRPSVVGAVVGGLGTSIAELIVAALATARHSPQLAVGSLVGSIIANVCLALALSAVIAPIRVESAIVWREAPVSVASVVAFAVLAGLGLSLASGIALLVLLFPVVALLVLRARHRPGARRGASGPVGAPGATGRDALEADVVEFVDVPRHRPRPEFLRALVSLGLMLGGAELMVVSDVGLAGRLGMAQGFAGLTIVGIGTSAPLIASSIQAGRRREHSLLLGNVLGGNLFIALGGGAVVGLLAGQAVASPGALALGLMAGAAAVSWLAMLRGHMLTRWEAAALLVGYVVMLPFVNR
jgi:cation:H+ antiporter